MPVKLTVLPTAVAVRVVMEDVPPIFKIPVAALVKPPVPANAVATVSVPLFVKVIPVTVTLGIERTPESA